MTPQITVELQIEYIRVLLARLRTPSADADAGSLCDRIEANLDGLVELLVDAPSPSEASIADDVVSEPASNYSDAIPAPEPQAGADPTDLQDADDVATESPASRPAADIPSDGMGPEEADRQPTEAPAATNPPSHQRPSSGVDGASPPPALVPLTVETLAANGHVPLSPRQREVLDAYREAGGNQRAAAERLGTSTGAVSGTLYQLRGTGRLPADIADLMASAAWKRTARRAGPEEKAPAPVRDGHAEMVLRAEADAQRIAHGIAERARAAAPDVVAAREADDSKHRDRAKAKADQVWRERHPEQA